MTNCIFCVVFFYLFFSLSVGSLRYSQINSVFMSIFKGMFEASMITIDEYGEPIIPFYNKNSIKNIELAIMSFGQGINVTPLQLITAVSAIANGGTLVKPQIISKIVNNDTGSITSSETTNVRQVISKETADNVLDMMEYVVTDGTGKKGSVKGYTIAGKTAADFV